MSRTYNLKIGKDFAKISSSIEDKYPSMVSTFDGKRVKEEVIQQRKVIYSVDGNGIEKPNGKAVVITKDGQETMIPLVQMENLDGKGVQKVSRLDILKYCGCGNHKIYETSLDLKEDEAITFVFALTKGYQNACRGFIYRDGQQYYLAKTSINSLDTLGKGFVMVKGKEEVKETINPLEQLRAMGIMV